VTSIVFTSLRRFHIHLKAYQQINIWKSMMNTQRYLATNRSVIGKKHDYNDNDLIIVHYHWKLFINIKKQNLSKDPRWQQEGGSRQHELHESKVFLRCWSHTWQKKTTKKKQNFDTLNSQPIQSFSMPHCTKKTGGLPCCQMQAPNLPGRNRPTGEQISSMWCSHSHPWDKPA
jgi:hypothetical protein